MTPDASAPFGGVAGSLIHLSLDFFELRETTPLPP